MNKYKLQKWFIDTDIGDDIDDAIALLYACNARLNIVGVSTVYRCSMMRAKLAKHILSLCGCGNIPVYAGIDKAIIQDGSKLQISEKWLPQSEIEQVKNPEWLPHYFPEIENAKVEKSHAVDAIIENAKKHRDILSIMAIGPLTNIAFAIRKAPEICSYISEIILMGGNFNDVAEWNFKLDPESAYIVINSGINIKIIGSDITWECCTFSQKDFLDFKYKIENKYDFINKMLTKWQEQPLYKGKTPCMHDSLPVAAIIEPDIVSFKSKNIKLGLSGNERAKIIINKKESERQATVLAAISADKERFWNSFNKNI